MYHNSQKIYWASFSYLGCSTLFTKKAGQNDLDDHFMFSHASTKCRISHYGDGGLFYA